MLPLIQQQMVDNGFMSMNEVADMVSISQATPGPFSLNAATFAGMKLNGVFGAVVATFALVLPSIILALIAAKFLFHFQEDRRVKAALLGIRPVVIALIATAAVSLAGTSLIQSGATEVIGILQKINWQAVGICAVSLFALIKLKIPQIWTILGSGVAGGVLFLIL